MAGEHTHQSDRSRRTLLKGALLSGSLAGCLGSGGEETPGSNGGGFSPTPTESPTPTPTATPIQPSREAHPLPNDADVLDRIVFGSEPSESGHDLAPETSELVEDRYGTLGRRILSGTVNDQSLGSVSLEMACDPAERTYLTLKIPVHGNSYNRLQLIDENDELVGTMGATGAWPALNPRFEPRRDGPVECGNWLDYASHSEYVYTTARLPEYLTEGSDTVFLRIANTNITGKGYPSMPLIRAYTHAEPLFELPPDEAGGHTHDIGTSAGPADDPMASKIETIDSYVSGLQSNETVGMREVHGLAMAYSRGDWIESVDQAAILDTVVNTVDNWARKQAESSPSELLANRRAWEEYGHLGRAINLLEEPLREEGLLSAGLEDHPEAPIQRSEAYAQFFDAGIEWRAQSLRGVYNQIAIVTKNLLRANRALKMLDAERARDQDQVDHWIDQMIGIEPTGGRGAPYPGSGTYHTATEAGITKEGAEYATHYGQLGIHETVALAHETGLERVEERAKEMVEAFGQLRWFTRGGCDSENRTIAADGAISVRNYAHPGIASGYRGYGFTPLYNAMVLEDDVSKRWAELAIEHDAISAVERRSRPGSLRRRIPQVEGYRAVTDMDASEYTIPQNREQHVWVDVDMGLVSVVDGDTQFMADIPHSASTNANDHGVTDRCAVHYQEPEQGDRVIQADIRRVEFPTNGDTWTRPDNLNWASDFLGPNTGSLSEDLRTRHLPWRGEEKYIHNAMAGEEVPQTAQIDGNSWPGANGASDSPDPRVGMGIHYREVKIGQYLIGINSTGNEQRGFGPGREFWMEVPAAEATNLETGETVTGDTVTVPPRSGVVLKLEE